MTDIVDIVDGLDLVVGLADGHLHPDDLDSARRARATPVIESDISGIARHCPARRHRRWQVEPSQRPGR